MMLPTSAAQYLRDEFVRSFANEANPANWDPANDKGVFAITLLCLTYWNAAAGLAFGRRANSAVTIRFMSDTLAHAPVPFGGRYRERAAIIYSLFRHGLVHQRFPGPVRGTSGDVTWVLGRDLEDQQHLALYGPLRANEAMCAFGAQLSGRVWLGGTPAPPALSYLGLKPDLLYQHSLREFERFAQRCEHDPDLSQTVREGIRAAKTASAPDKAVKPFVDLALGAPDPWPQQPGRPVE